MKRITTASACALALAAALTLSSCSSDSDSSNAASGSGDGSGSGTTVTADSNAASLVPADIKSKGTITIATSASTAPAEFVDGGKVVGGDIDLIKAIGSTLGLKVEIANVPFDSIIPGIQASRYDAAISTFAINAEREQIVDMVSYGQAGGEFLVPADATDYPKTLADLCGVSISVLQGSTDLDAAQDQSTQCTSAGKSPVDIKIFPDQNAAVLAVASGRAKAMIFNSVAAGYTAEQSGGKLKETGTTYNPVLLGIAVPKDPGLAKAIVAAIKVLQENGQYADILKKWNSSTSAIESTQVAVNPAAD